MNTNQYPIRVIFTRGAETSRKILSIIKEAQPEMSIHSPALLVEGPEDKAFHLCAEMGDLKIFVVHTEEGPYKNHPNIIYTMSKHYRAGIILYITGETLGFVKPSRYNLYPSIPMARDEDVDAYFKSGIVGNSAKEMQASETQKLEYLLSLPVDEARPKKNSRAKKVKAPGAPKKAKGPQKKHNKNTKPRKLKFEDQSGEEEEKKEEEVTNAHPSTVLPWGITTN